MSETTTEDKAAVKSAATLLVELAQKSYEFGVSDTGESYAVPVSGPKVVLSLRGGRTSLSLDPPTWVACRAGPNSENAPGTERIGFV